MAGDWIKMRLDLTEDPAIIAMADSLGVREEVVVGYCHSFWSWVSRQCHDGSVTGVTLDALGRKLNLPGFPQLLVSVGWLEYSKSCDKPQIFIPKFERHLSQGAKERALATERKRHARVAKMSRPKRDKNGTREEKRREEYVDTNVSTLEANASCDEAAKPHSPPSPFTFPTRGKVRQWNLPEAKLAEYLESYPGLDVAAELRSAVQWCRDNGTKQKTATGMPAFLSRWLAKAANSGHSTNGKPAKPQSRVLEPHEYHLYDPHSPTGMRDE